MTLVIMPKVGISVESCVLTKWHKKAGDPVKKGEVLFSYETDKTSVDEEAPADGVLLKCLYNEGDDVPVMRNVCAIGKAGEDVSALVAEASVTATAVAAEPDRKASVTPPVSAPAVAAEPIVNAPVSQDGRLKISPRARILAARKGVDPAIAAATGAEGRVCERDIAALAAQFTGTSDKSVTGTGTGIGGRISSADTGKIFTSAPPKIEYIDEKLSSVRKVVAKVMTESLSTMAQLTHHASFDASGVLAFRASVKAKAKDYNLPNITINDIILYAVSRTLPAHKAVNAHLLGDTMRYFNAAHIGMAVDTDKGLLVPTLFNADSKSLIEISKEAKSLAEAAQKGTIAPDKLKGASFTVSNLGTLGVEAFTPVINPPQTCILGVCCPVERVRTMDGKLTTYQSVGLSLTFDHRALDGAPAARFLQDLCRNLENFAFLLL